MPGWIRLVFLNMAQIELFFLALSFYTRLPAPKTLDYNKLPQASSYLPLIGWITGGLTGLVCYGAQQLWPQPVAVILALSFSLILTGAFHEDGFADVCDGFGGGYGKARILEIMKDSRIGAYGAIGMLMLMALKIGLLTFMPGKLLPFILFCAHSVSRWPPLLTMRRYEYARADAGKSANAVYKPSFVNLLLAGVAALLPLLLLPPVLSVSIVFILITHWQFSRYCFKFIGGYTGDCLGASQQIAEVVFYLSISALWKFT